MTSKKGKMPAARPKSEIVYWMRFGLALLSAMLCALLRLHVEGIAVGLSIYLTSYILARHVVKPNIGLGRYENYLLGLGTYFATWLTFWFLLYTLMSPSVEALPAEGL